MPVVIYLAYVHILYYYVHRQSSKSINTTSTNIDIAMLSAEHKLQYYVLGAGYVQQGTNITEGNTRSLKELR